MRLTIRKTKKVEHTLALESGHGGLCMFGSLVRGACSLGELYVVNDFLLATRIGAFEMIGHRRRQFSLIFQVCKWQRVHRARYI